ncbi:acyl-CoA dehydrogenase family protein [Rhizobium rhizogenes]|uniref:acyl-CoA dehydrogenase family protein n=1 Tax=Rhizobium rhizogenes TaxID=359 RepID=UPI001572F89E|nr:acyl-CoA dehydrogenase family protein [Rhizobium rhizogenes]NTI78657.1 hypothetical protein [Rhizobium rhizogenes]
MTFEAVEGDHYRLNGTKSYSTGSMFSDWIRVTALTEAGDGVNTVIPVDREGVHFEDDWDGIGQRLTGSGTTVLTNVVVNADEILTSKPEDGSGYAFKGTLSQVFLTGVIVGILFDIVHDGSRLLRERKRNFIHSTAEVPANDPQLQEILGRLSSYAYAAEAAILAAAAALDAAERTVVNGAPTPETAHQAALEAAKAKVVIDELAQSAASALFDLGGASATQRSLDLDRHWRNVRTISSHNPRQYKARAIGDLEANGTLFPPNAFF